MRGKSRCIDIGRYRRQRVDRHGDRRPNIGRRRNAGRAWAARDSQSNSGFDVAGGVHRVEHPVAELGSGGSDASAAAGLTPRQLQIIRRVAEGRTNREIATELYLSVRTVDMHVRHSLIALGCRSRMDAARKASGLGLLEQP